VLEPVVRRARRPVAQPVPGPVVRRARQAGLASPGRLALPAPSQRGPRRTPVGARAAPRVARRRRSRKCGPPRPVQVRGGRRWPNGRQV